jgi:hypothetical protein
MLHYPVAYRALTCARFASSEAPDRLLSAFAAESRHQRTVYQALLREHGNETYRTLHWDSEEGQTKRFDALLNIMANRPKSPSGCTTVMDLGSGLGDLSKHLHARLERQQQPGFVASATLPVLPTDIGVVGVDIIPEFCDLAATRHPQSVFLCRDLLQLPPAQARLLLRESAAKVTQLTKGIIASGDAEGSNEVADLDYGVCSGMFAFGSERFMTRMLRLVVPLVRRGFAFNIHESEDTRFLKLPRQKAIDICASFPGVNKIELFDDYWHSDYTVFVHK